MRLVGFTTGNIVGKELEAEAFIKKVCLLLDPNVAKNIVRASPGVNVFTNATTIEELESLPFDVTPITVDNGEFLIASAVNFTIEIGLDKMYRLLPTEFIRVTNGDLYRYYEFAKIGLVKPIPYTDISKWPKNPPLEVGNIFDETFDQTFN